MDWLISFLEEWWFVILFSAVLVGICGVFVWGVTKQGDEQTLVEFLQTHKGPFEYKTESKTMTSMMPVGKMIVPMNQSYTAHFLVCKISGEAFRL